MAINLPPVPNLSGYMAGAFGQTLSSGLSSLSNIYLQRALDKEKLQEKIKPVANFLDTLGQGGTPDPQLIAQVVAQGYDPLAMKDIFDKLNSTPDPIVQQDLWKQLIEYIVTPALNLNVPVEEIATFAQPVLTPEMEAALGGRERAGQVLQQLYTPAYQQQQQALQEKQIQTEGNIYQNLNNRMNLIKTVLNEVTDLKNRAIQIQQDMAKQGVEASLEDILQDTFGKEINFWQGILKDTLGIDADLTTNTGYQTLNNLYNNYAKIVQQNRELETQQRQIGIESTKWGIERTKAEIQRLKTLDEQRVSEEGKIPAQTQWKYGKVGRTFWGVGAIDDPIDSALYSASVPLGEDLIRKVQEGEFDTPEGNLDVDKFKREWAIAATAIQDPSPYLNMATAGVNELNSLLQQKYGVDLATLDRQINPQAYQGGNIPPYIQLLQSKPAQAQPTTQFTTQTQPTAQPTTQVQTQPTTQPTAPTPTPEDLKQNLINTFVQNVSAAPREKIQAVIVELNTPTSGGYQELINRGLTPQDIQELLRRLEQILAQSR